MKKYILKVQFLVPTSQRPNYLLSLCCRLKSYFYGPFDECEIESTLHTIDSFINEHQFIIRNAKHSGKIIIRKIKDNQMDIYSMTGNRVLLTVSLVPTNQSSLKQE